MWAGRGERRKGLVNNSDPNAETAFLPSALMKENANVK